MRNKIHKGVTAALVASAVLTALGVLTLLSAGLYAEQTFILGMLAGAALLLTIFCACLAVTLRIKEDRRLEVCSHTCQGLIDQFNAAYAKACESSEPEDWGATALLGRQLIYQLGLEGVLDDNFHTARANYLRDCGADDPVKEDAEQRDGTN